MVCFHEYFVHIKRCIINGWGFCCIFGIRLSFGSQFKQNKHSITLWLRHHFNLVIKITPKIRGVPFTSWTVKTNINKTQHKMMGSQRHNEELQSSWWVENGSLDLNKNGSFHRFFSEKGVLITENSLLTRVMSSKYLYFIFVHWVGKNV